MANETATVQQVPQKKYSEDRFEFTLYVNNFIICKRYFRINDFIDHSMESLEFKNEVDNIVKLIQDDLVSKSRVYTWYYFNPNEKEPLEEFTEPLAEPWECTFKFVISDRRKPVITRIWDGYAYPKAVREKVDLTNKLVKFTNREGKQFIFDKDGFFNNPENKVTYDQQVLKAQIMDKSDLIVQITKMICETCSPSGGDFKTTSDYTLVDEIGDNRYNLNLRAHNRKIEKAWETVLKEKTDNYFKNLF